MASDNGTRAAFDDESTPAAPDLKERLRADAEQIGAEHPVRELPEGLIGFTMFDQGTSTDGTLTVLLSRQNLHLAPSQSLVRIKSEDDRTYLGVVTAGPFAEPDSLKADSSIMVALAVRGGGNYMPPFHGRVQVDILGEELSDGTLCPPRWRPLPHSHVFQLSEEESAAVLKAEGDIRLGLAVGHESLEIRVPSDKKSVFPKHTAILGTTGGGKSTTVAGLIKEAQQAGMAVIVLDVEGEYSFLHEPTEDAGMIRALKDRDLPSGGIPVKEMGLYHLIGRECANPDHPNRREFSLQFAKLSPYVAAEMLGLSEAQQTRFFQAYDIAKEILRDLNEFPKKGDAEQERMALEIDEFERGYPRMTVPLLMDVVGACLARADRSGSGNSRSNKKTEADEVLADFNPYMALLKSPEGRQSLLKRVHTAKPSGQSVSWRALLSRLARLNRLRVLYDEKSGIEPLVYKRLLKPGRVSVIDLSDSGASELNNLVIADLLRGIQQAQDEDYQRYEQEKANNPNAKPPARVLVIIEEAHEFLSVERIDKMEILFQQVARIAKRGRKRWLGLTFVTQLPQHLPRQVFGLVNSYILHKITDPQVVSNLKKTVVGIDESLWNQLPGLAPGQAIVAFPHMTRPMLVSIDPAASKLRLVD